MNMQEYHIDERLLEAAIQKGVNKAMRTRLIYRAAVVLVALITLSAGAVAAGHYMRVIGLDGEPLPLTQLQPDPTQAPPQPTESALERLDTYATMVTEDKPDFEYWVITMVDGQSTDGSSFVSFETLESFEAADRIRASGLSLPSALPAGYTVNELLIYFYLTEQDIRETTLLAEERPETGLTLKRYLPPERIQDQIERYELTCVNGDGEQVRIHAERSHSSTQWGFGVWDDRGYEAVSVAGMANALLMTWHDNESSSLYLRQENTPLRWYVSFPYSPSIGAMVEDGYGNWQAIDDTWCVIENAGSFETEHFDTTFYTIDANKLTKEEMIALAESLE